MQENYRKSYPRPFPCGSLILGFDRRRIELLGHRLDIASGLCRVDLLAEGKPVVLELFVEMNDDRLWLRLLDAAGNPVPNLFDRVRLLPTPTASTTPPWAAQAIQRRGKPFPAILICPLPASALPFLKIQAPMPSLFARSYPFSKKAMTPIPRIVPSA